MVHRGPRLVIGLLVLGALVPAGCAGSAAATHATAQPAGAVVPAASVASAGSVSPRTASASPTPTPDPCSPNPIKFDPAQFDLTGTWMADDGGIYYVRQLGSVVWWNGMSGLEGPAAFLGRGFNNVGRGVIDSKLAIIAQWADVPRGSTTGSGEVHFQVGADSSGMIRLTKTYDPGDGRDDTTWEPCLEHPV